MAKTIDFQQKKWNLYTTDTDLLVTAVLLLILWGEGVHLLALFGGKSLSFCAYLYGAGFCVGAAAFVIILFFQHSSDRQRRQGSRRRAAKETASSCQLLTILTGLLILLQIVWVLTNNNCYTTGDMTLETVNSFLAENGVYRVNPLTGLPYTQGLPLRIKILCLPTTYAIWSKILSSVLSLGAQTVVCHLAPAAVLLCGYLIYAQLAGIFFPESKEKRMCFLILVAGLFYVGNYLYGMDGMGALYGGFMGVSVRALILLPYTVSLILRGKGRWAFLCVAAEACLVWTLYGMGTCLLVMAGMYLAGKSLRKGRRA